MLNALERQALLTIMPDGSIVRFDINPTNLGPCSSILEQVMASSPRLARNAFEVDGLPIGMQVKANQIATWMLIPHLVLNTIYATAGGECWPTGRTMNTTDFGATFKWVPPASMRVWLTTVITPLPDGTYRLENDYLVATNPTEKVFYRLPLGNLYEDGRVCNGNSLVKINKTLSGLIETLFHHFQTSPWNSDLIAESGGDANVRRMFHFSMDGVQLPAPDNWPAVCRKINLSTYSELPIPV